MFFMFGLTSGRKKLNFHQTAVCGNCGSYGQYLVYMTFLQFIFFFIPLFKASKRYYVQMSCCGTTYELVQTVGKRIERGEDVTIQPEDLRMVSGGDYDSMGDDHWFDGGVYSSDNSGGHRGWKPEDHEPCHNREKSCPNCGYTTSEDFEYCPKCGQRLV